MPAVDQREFRGLLIIDQCKISPPEHDRLSALLLDQPLAGRIEDGSLCISHYARDRHRDVGLVHIKHVLSTWRNDFRRRDATIEAGLHDRSSSKDADAVETTLCYCLVDFGNHIDDGQR